jgi:hypothetical protein
MGLRMSFTLRGIGSPEFEFESYNPVYGRLVSEIKKPLKRGMVLCEYFIPEAAA